MKVHYPTAAEIRAGILLTWFRQRDGSRWTRDALAHAFGCKRTILLDALKVLVAQGFVTRTIEKRPHRGRPLVFYALAKGA